MEFALLVPIFHFLKREKSNLTNNGKTDQMNANEKYFLNSLRYVPCSGALSSFQSSERMTRDIRFEARLALRLNFAPFHSAKLNIFQTLCESLANFIGGV